MKTRKRQPLRWVLLALATLWMVVIVPLSAAAAPYAAMVIDARSGEVLHSRNADSRLHPASLTKMMTLYVVFEAVENGEISLDDITVSRRHAEVQHTEQGYAVADSGSLNGTYVNQQRVERAMLQHGDELQIGKFRLVFFERADG